METTFTDRQHTGLSLVFQQTVNTLATRYFVNFDVTWAWYTYLPVINWFLDSDLNFNDEDVITYEF